MTDEQLNCEHNWCKMHGGYCRECFVKSGDWKEYLLSLDKREINVNDLPKPYVRPNFSKLSKGIGGSALAAKEYEKERAKVILKREEDMGCPASAPKRWNPEGYLHGDRSDFKPKSNGTH